MLLQAGVIEISPVLHPDEIGNLRWVHRACALPRVDAFGDRREVGGELSDRSIGERRRRIRSIQGAP